MAVSSVSGTSGSSSAEYTSDATATSGSASATAATGTASASGTSQTTAASDTGTQTLEGSFAAFDEAFNSPSTQIDNSMTGGVAEEPTATTGAWGLAAANAQDPKRAADRSVTRNGVDGNTNVLFANDGNSETEGSAEADGAAENSEPAEHDWQDDLPYKI